jgi:hypothetical protein
MSLWYYVTKADAVYIQMFSEANERTCSGEATNVEYGMNKVYTQNWLLCSDDTIKSVYDTN